ncbi:MAG: SpoIID/LytB domain-containing protein [Planctomycetes bacterium]|nr:SpoIID/LytB domain-containing protein [Planctomycetota bacterium]
MRVGLVLPEDGCHILHVELLNSAFTLQETIADQSPAPESAESAAGKDLRGRSLTFQQTDRGGVHVQVDGDDQGEAGVWELCPSVGRAHDTFRCRDLRIGRGFHWEHYIDQCVPGPLRIGVQDGALTVVADLPIETYLLGVITAEMSDRCPPAFLTAQCVAARSWLLAASERKHETLGIDVCNDDCCQRFHGLSETGPVAQAAVRETAGQVLIVGDDTIVDANYSKNCGGITETPHAVWGFAKPGPHPIVDAPPDSPAQQYLPVSESRLDEFLSGEWLDQCDAYCSPSRVPDRDLAAYLGRVDDGQGRFRWAIDYRRDELEAILNAKLLAPSAGDSDSRRNPHPPMATLLNVRVVQRGVSGRATRMRIDYSDDGGRRHRVTVDSEYAIRDALHERFLFSSAFAIDLSHAEDGSIDRIGLRGAGWGHGVGLCQIGALGRALAGQDYRTILAAYFKDSHIQQAYPAGGAAC